LILKKPPEEAAALLEGAASVLFLATGKSDNNAKCQLPLYLRDKAKWAGFPAIRRKQLTKAPLPRVLKSDDYMGLVASLAGHPEDQKRLLQEFVKFLLSDEQYVAQLWSIGHSYNSLKAFDKHRSLLTPLVIFQVRGSVSASGGHTPEALLRERLDEWGLLRGTDYNTSDVVIAAEVVAGASRVKTRAYDFVLPFQTPGWDQRIFIQSQFYAGDSGSVSHKNVDQTSTSRAKVLEKHANAFFDEYVDGAGYFSSLNGDLKTLLSMANTHSFIQVRSAPIRLRRTLQEIGFLTPLEVEQAVARTGGKINDVGNLLASEGYQKGEVQRCLDFCAQQKFLAAPASGVLGIRDERRALVRRYLILDTIACNGAVPNQDDGTGKVGGYLLVPGYGPLYGTKLLDVLTHATKVAPGFAKELADSKTMLADVQWLEEKQWIMAS
jgi:hypothetical protein